MKKLLLLPLLLLLTLPAGAQTSTITRAEYFFDTDPGFNAGTNITFSPAGDSVATITSIALPVGLKRGPHKLYVRSQVTQLPGGKEYWSLQESASFYVQGEIAAVEYFFDTDPGLGLGTALTVPSPSDSVSLTPTIVVSGLPAGKHTLFVRTKTTDGVWSLAEGKSFHKEAVITAAEYFFDTDPGFGLGTAIAVPSPSDSVLLTPTIAVTSLSTGNHILYVRTKDDKGTWSMTESRQFYRLPRVVAAEYFFDTDPGLGLGTTIAVPAPSDSVSLTPTIAVTSLSFGNHILYARTKDDKGTWSIAEGQQFYRVPRLVAAEYFWDTDPGLGAGIPIPVAVPSDSIALTPTLLVPCIPAGAHVLYARAQDERGLWGLVDSNVVNIVSPPVVVSAVFPGPGPTGTPLKVTATGGLPPYTFSVNSGIAGTDSVFLVPNNALVTFMATDSCSNVDAGSFTTPVAPTAISAPGGVAVSQTIVFTGWRAPVYFQDADGKIIGYLDDKGENLGAVTLRANTNTSGTGRQFNNGEYFLDRNWVVEDTSTLTTSRELTLFGTTAELNALKAQDPGISSVADLSATKYDGVNQDLLETNNWYLTGNFSIFAPSATGSVTDGFTVTLVTNSFSEFYLSRNSGIPLPLEGLRFGASLAGKKVALQWSVQQEEGVLRYTVQRLAGSDWQNIETQQAQGKAGATYVATDAMPQTGANRYRLRVTHISGRETFSPVVTVIVAGGESVVIAPNPASGTFYIQGMRAAGKAMLRNMLGQEVYAAPLSAGDNQLDVAFLPAGNYGLQIVMADGSSIWERLVLVQ